MTLVVDFAEFPEAVTQFKSDGECCVMYRRVGDSTHFTYVNPQLGVQVVSMQFGSEKDGIADLESRGFATLRGMWVTDASLEHLEQLAGDTYVAAVAYETKKGPGLWIDAYPYPPTEGTVLRTVFEEFVNQGLLDEREFERFIQEGKPMVRVLSPTDAEQYLKEKRRGKEKGGLR